MTEITIISGFLGAGKTTLIKKLLEECFQGEKIVLIENEFGEIGIDGGFLKDSGIQVNEMNSGCICCSLVGDFGLALKEVLDTYKPDRILIEPSGVGKLSDVVKAVEAVARLAEVHIDSSIVVVDGKKCKMFMKNFGEFFNNQIEHAGTIVISRTQSMTDEKLEECVALLKEHNHHATMITTPWDELEGKQILAAMYHAELEMEGHHHHHHHHEHDENCTCGCHDHDHHHEHGDHCSCGCHDHEHHHHEEEKLPGVVYTKVRLHDDAKVVSGSLTVFGDYEKVREGLNRGLTEFAAAVTEKGGIIGHIKASAEVKNVEMFSVTDVDVMIKTAPEQEINIILAAIVFFVTEEEAETLGKKALEAAIC